MEPKQTVNVRLCAEYINHVKVHICTNCTLQEYHHQRLIVLSRDT